MFINEENTKKKEGTMFVLGVRIDNISGTRALEFIDRILSSGNGLFPHSIYFANVHTIHLARKDREFQRMVNRGDLVLPDGSGLSIAGKLFGKPIVENLNGTDFVPRVLQMAEERGWSVFLLGGSRNVLELCRKSIERSYPQLRVAGAHQGYLSPDEELKLVNQINTENPDILLVAMGSPIQERWISQHAHLLKTRVCFAVGGLFDFLSGAIPRAPRWMRAAGIEWLFRLFQSPKDKWNRAAIEMPSFLALVIAKRILPRRLQEWITRVRLAR